MTTPSPEIAVASAVKALVEPVLGEVPFYDHVPAGGQLETPLCALGVVSSRRIPDRCGRSWETGFRLHLFSKAAADGRVWVWATLHTLREALDGVKPVLASPHVAATPLREVRTADAADRLQAFDQAYIDFALTVSSPT